MSDDDKKSVEDEKAPKTCEESENAKVIEETLKATEPEEESLREQFVRLQADFTNFRNRTQRERIDLYQRANQDLVLDILPVLDHFEMGLKTARQHSADTAVVDGLKLVLDQLQNVLNRFGLKPIKASGERFDPHLHEALTHMPSEAHPEGICINQVRCGYLFGGKLLRAAQVIVSSGSPESVESESQGP